VESDGGIQALVKLSDGSIVKTNLNTRENISRLNNVNFQLDSRKDWLDAARSRGWDMTKQRWGWGVYRQAGNYWIFDAKFPTRKEAAAYINEKLGVKKAADVRQGALFQLTPEDEAHAPTAGLLRRLDRIADPDVRERITAEEGAESILDIKA
jgi:hypothetical protein